MKKLFFLLGLISVMLFGEVYSVKTEKIITGTGYGTSREEAVNNALIEALSQLNGVYIKKSSINQDVLVEGDKKSVSVFTYQSKIDKLTQGRVDSFRIDSVEEISPHKFVAKVSVTKTRVVNKYKSPGLNPRNRRAVAVIPFEYKKSYSFYGVAVDGKALSDRINQAIVNKLTQTRKFTVLDRENSKYYEFEKNFLLNPNTDPVELARLGKRLGADYFVIGKILDFGIDKKTQTISYTGRSFSEKKGYATISYRILNIPTQQIKWADTIDIEFDIPENKTRPESIVALAADKIAQILVEQIIFNIYPPKIIRVSGKRVLINMGGKFIHKGDVFEVYALGEKLYDPYTKEYLGRDEEYTGKVKITKVLPKISHGRVIEGKAVTGAVLRKPEKEAKKINNKGKDSMFDAVFGK